MATLGGQTAINLAGPLHDLGVKLIGTDVQAIENAENRDCFEKIMEQLGIDVYKRQDPCRTGGVPLAGGKTMTGRIPAGLHTNKTQTIIGRDFL